MIVTYSFYVNKMENVDLVVTSFFYVVPYNTVCLTDIHFRSEDPINIQIVLDMKWTSIGRGIWDKEWKYNYDLDWKNFFVSCSGLEMDFCR